MKVLTLIIYSEDLPVYKEHQKAWRLYSKSHPSFDVYFMICSPEYSKTTLIDDMLYVPGQENFGNMPYKFISALEFFDYKKYDFILRTNMSSFWVFDNLLPLLEVLPNEGLLAGESWGNFISGAGMIFTPDVCDILVENKQGVYDTKPTEADDVRISQYLNEKHHIPYIQTFPKRHDIVFPEDGTEEKIPANVFHIRVKQELEKRHLEYGIMWNLYKRFYNSNGPQKPDEPSSLQP